MAGNGLKLLEWLEMADNGSKLDEWLKMATNGWKGLEIACNGLK